MATTATDRIDALDVIRGVAVMGILVANLPSFALPGSAYFSPLPWGGSRTGDRVAWALNFVLIEGKMRGLFTLLFGASVLLVVERARAAGRSGARTHYSRMFWLFAIGSLHLYLFWWGDILTHYALVGAAAYLFTRLPVASLLVAGAIAVVLSILMGLGGAFVAFSGDAVAAALLEGFGAPDRAELAAEVSAMRGGFSDGVAWRWRHAANPLVALPVLGPETLGYMLWGMAGLKSGFLTGAWERRRYARWALATLPIGWAAYAVLAWMTSTRGFDPRYVFLGSIAAAAPIRPLLIVGYACLIMLAAEPGGWLTKRIAAAGRAAFSNYLGTTLMMTFVFSGWGLGQFGRVGRAEMYLLVPVVWGLMLLWSKPWLEHHRYGPLEWAWRSLSRRALQPMRIRRARTS